MFSILTSKLEPEYVFQLEKHGQIPKFYKSINQLINFNNIYIYKPLEGFDRLRKLSNIFIRVWVRNKQLMGMVDQVIVH